MIKTLNDKIREFVTRGVTKARSAWGLASVLVGEVMQHDRVRSVALRRRR
jgi:hypothetical protein